MTRQLVVGLAASLVLMLGLLAFLLMSRPAAVPGTELDRVLATVGVQISLPADAALSRVELDGDHLKTLLAVSGDDRLRIQVTQGLDEPAAQTRIDDLRAVIDNLFGDRQAPYPGQLSNTLKCPERFQPEELPRGTWARAVIALYANDRLAFGGCSEDLLRYHATVGFFYDPAAQRLFQVEYFAAVGAASDAAADPGSQVIGSFSLTSGGTP